MLCNQFKCPVNIWLYIAAPKHCTIEHRQCNMIFYRTTVVTNQAEIQYIDISITEQNKPVMLKSLRCLRDQGAENDTISSCT